MVLLVPKHLYGLLDRSKAPLFFIKIENKLDSDERTLITL